MEKKKKSGQLLEKASELFDLPGEVLAGLPRVEIVGGRAVIEGHKGILEYQRDLLIINGGRMTVRLRGEDLEIRSMNASELLITGTIFGVDFEF